MVSFSRVNDRPIRARDPIVAPDALIIVDSTLLHQVDAFGGLRADGSVLINSSRDLDSLGWETSDSGLPTSAYTQGR